MLLGVPKIEIIVGQGGQSDCMHRLNVLNNRGSNRPRKSPRMKPMSSRTVACSSRPPLKINKIIISTKYSSSIWKTYVCHESTKTTQSLSILPTLCSRRTTLRTHYVALSKRSSDLSTGQAETTSVERSLGAGHLQDTLALRNEG